MSTPLERALGDVDAELHRWHLAQQCVRFVAAFTAAFVPALLTAGVRDLTWSAVAGIAAGAAVTVVRQLVPTVPVGSLVARLRAEPDAANVTPGSTRPTPPSQ